MDKNLGKNKRKNPTALRVSSRDIRQAFDISPDHELTREELRGGARTVGTLVLSFLTSKVTSGSGIFCKKDEVQLDDSTSHSTQLKEDLTLFMVNSHPASAQRVPEDDEGLLGYYNSQNGKYYSAPRGKHVVTMMKSRAIANGVPAERRAIKSFRSGLVSELERAGVDEGTIRVSGGWAKGSKVPTEIYSRSRPVGVLALAGRVPIDPVTRAASIPSSALVGGSSNKQQRGGGDIITRNMRSPPLIIRRSRPKFIRLKRGRGSKRSTGLGLLRLPSGSTLLEG